MCHKRPDHHNPLQDSPYTYPAAYNSIGQTTTYRIANGFVPSDPFRVTNRNGKVDAPSDGLTFDDIPTAPRRSQFYVIHVCLLDRDMRERLCLHHKQVNQSIQEHLNS